MKNKKNNKNAITHGLYARDTVLPWEDSAAFTALHHTIRQELYPVGPLEEEEVREIAELTWRKQRLALGFLLPYYTNLPPAELLEAAKGGLESLASYLAEAGPAEHRTFSGTTVQLLDYINAGKADAATSLPPGQPAAAHPSSVVEQACDPVAIEKQLKAEAMIDNRIAKAMSRLIGIKEYKKLYGPTPAAVPVTSAPALVPPANETPEAVPELDAVQANAAVASTEGTKPSGGTATKMGTRT